MSNIDILKKAQIFETLSDDELKELSILAELRDYPDGETIFEEGDKSEDIFILIDGRVAIEIQMQVKSEKAAVHTVEPGQVFGEFALIDGEPRSASAETVKPSKLLVISIEKIKNLMDNNPKIGYKIMRNFNRILSARTKKTTKELRASLLWN